MPVSS